jgi:hypothetical protein
MADYSEYMIFLRILFVGMVILYANDTRNKINIIPRVKNGRKRIAIANAVSGIYFLLFISSMFVSDFNIMVFAWCMYVIAGVWNIYVIKNAW